jgi:hypothetical protein
VALAADELLELLEPQPASARAAAMPRAGTDLFNMCT